MALAATQVWEVRGTGDAANSGGFNSAAAGTDRTLQDAPHVIIDGVTITATVNATTTDLDIVGYATGAADVGNTIRITGGTMTAGTYQIDSIVGGRWRLDRSAGTAGQTGTGRMGGANSDPALIAAVTVGSNRIWIKAATYSMTSATPNIAGGTVSTPVGAQVWAGYQATRGDFGTPPVFLASGINTATLFALSQNDCKAYNIDVNGASLVAIRGISATGRATVYKCVARNCTNSGIRSSSTSTALLFCGATGCATAGSAIEDAGGGVGGWMYGCWARGNTVTGITLNGYIANRCISASNTGATSDGFTVASNLLLISCTAYGNGRHGFNSAGNNGTRYVNCIAEANVTSGFNFTGAGNSNVLINCAVFGNGANFAGTVQTDTFGLVTGTSTFFVNAAAGNFALNTNNGGGGGLLQNAVPSSFIDGLTLSYLDRGAAQTSGAPGTGGGAGGSLSIGQGTWVGR